MLKKPWEYHADLSADRLQLIAKVLRDSRRDTILLHDPGAGDTSWSLGCRIYARSADKLLRAGADLWPWLKVISPPLEFIFSVGEVPLRFFHGDSDHPKGQHLRVANAEAHQLDFAFGNGAVDLIWRLCVETNAAGETDQIVLIGSSTGGEIACKYVIPPLEGTVMLFKPLRPQIGSGVELPAPPVTPRKGKQLKDEDEGKEV